MSSNRLLADTANFCGLPLVRRSYHALVAALAVFILTLVIWREPFRGYLAEVQLSGPAINGLNLGDAAAWFKQSPHIAVISNSTQRPASRSQLRVTCLGPEAAVVRRRLDELAERWLYQYLPDRIQVARRTLLATLRTEVSRAQAHEDSAREQLERLRQEQIVALSQSAKQTAQPLVVTEAPKEQAAKTGSEDEAKLQEQLSLLKAELAKLLVRFTDAHPQVITLRSQIASLERQIESRGQEVLAAPLGVSRIARVAEFREVSHGPLPGKTAIASHLVLTPANARKDQALHGSESEGDLALTSEIDSALGQLTQASRARQSAERRFNDRMQELSNQPTAGQWKATRAEIVTRLGGTPRFATLALAMLLAAIAGGTMFWASSAGIGQPKIETAAELADTLEIPVLGSAAVLKSNVLRLRHRLLTRHRVRLAFHASEAIVGLAVAACLLAIVVEPSLAPQVFADPFGALAEVMGRFGV